MATDMGIHSDLPIPPGEYLEEILDDLGMTKRELAERLSRPAAKLSAMYKGDKAITPDTALQLEKVLGVPAHIWTGLESEYRLTLARLAQDKEEERLKDESGLTTAFCYGALAKLGLVKASRVGSVRVRELHRFLGVTSLRSIANVPRYGLAFRQASSVKKRPSQEALTAWLRIGEREAQATDCAVFDKARLGDSLTEIRSMPSEAPERFLPRLRTLLYECGIALVLCHHFPKTYLNGATFWLVPEKAVLMMTIRGKWSDIFWFSLFHEIGHLLLHGHREVFLEFETVAPERVQQEEQADHFAQDSLIPRESYRDFVHKGSFSPVSVRRFAERIDIHPGIVVGRLQNDERLRHFQLNDLRSQYVWKEE